MKKMPVINLIALLISFICLAAMPGQAVAKDSTGKAAKSVRAGKERLVLMPLRVSEDNKNLQAVMETALVQGLQQKYEVFEGEQVTQKAKEIFLKETRNTASKECNEIRCLQNIAEAFQAELIATANVTKVEGGYLLSLNIQNIFDNEAVYTNTLPCRNCDGFQVVEKLKVLDNEPVQIPAPSAGVDASKPATGNVAISENALWDEAQKNNKLTDYRAYLAQYPRGKFASIAEGRINILEEQATTELTQQDQNAWSNAINAASVAGYQEYLKLYPQGLYVVQAQARIKKLQGAQHDVEAETKPGREFQDCPECPEMVVLPAGDFSMGSNNGESDEQPVHRVTIGKAFAIGKTEITQGQWRALMSTTAVRTESRILGKLVRELKHALPEYREDVTGAHWDATQSRGGTGRGNAESSGGEKTVVIDNNPSFFKNCGDECPVEQVSWLDAQKYVQKLIAKTGKQYRLPSEAEWEYACRGGRQNEYCGSDSVESLAWYGGNINLPGNSGKTTHAVASLRANGFGLFDMSGNVWEWVEDSYHASYSGAPADGSIWIGDDTRHTLRGGAWSSKLPEVRAGQRSRNEPSSRGSVGFRVVRVLP